MVEGENNFESEAERYKPERELVRDVIFALPGTIVERQWISHFFDKDERIKRGLVEVRAGTLAPGAFMECLRPQIDFTILLFLQSRSMAENGWVLGRVEREFIVKHFADLRTDFMDLVLSVEMKKENRVKEVLSQIRTKLRVSRSSHRTDRRQGRAKNIDKITGRILLKSEMDLYHTFFVRKLDVKRLMDGLAGSEWVRRQVNRILQENNPMLQEMLLSDFINELPNQIF